MRSYRYIPEALCASLLLFSLPLTAATHTVEGCVSVLDTRVLPLLQGDPLPIKQARVWVDVSTILNKTVTKDAGFTDADGCFSLTVSGDDYPDAMSIFPYLMFQNDDMEIFQQKFSMTINDEQVTIKAGISSLPLLEEAVTTDGNNSYTQVDLQVDPDELVADRFSNQASLIWRSMTDSVDAYEQLTGSSWSGYNYKVEYPDDDKTYPHYRNGAIRLPRETTSPELSHEDNPTLMHELGHLVAWKDSSWLDIPPSYEFDWIFPDHPKQLGPYSYIDRVDNDRNKFSHQGGISPYNWSPEHLGRVSSESYANFLENYLTQYFTGNGLNCDEGQNSSLTFDGLHSAYAAIEMMCDMVDTGAESNAVWHQYSSQSNAVTRVALDTSQMTPEATFILGDIAQDQDYFYVVPNFDGASTQVWRGSFNADQVTLLADFSDTVGIEGDLAGIDVEDDLLCGQFKYSEIACVNKNNGSQPQKLEGSALSPALRDFKLYQGYLYGIDLAGQMRVSDNPIDLSQPNFNWVYVDFPYFDGSGGEYSIEIIPEYRLIETKDDETTKTADGGQVINQPFIVDHWVYVADSDSVVRCLLVRDELAQVSCVDAEKIAGNGTGYGRESAINARFEHIENLKTYNGELFVSDRYGVAKLTQDETGFVIEQVLGKGPGYTVYPNNLSQRAMNISGDTLRKPAYATNGEYAVFYGEHEQIDTNRNALISVGLTRFDTQAPLVNEYYCGSENVSVADPLSVLHMFKGKPFYRPWDKLLEDFVGEGILSELDVADISAANFTSLETCSASDWQEPTSGIPLYALMPFHFNADDGIDLTPDSGIPDSLVNPYPVDINRVWFSPLADSDGDGVKNEDDACVGIPGGVLDLDGDGCPDQAPHIVDFINTQVAQQLNRIEGSIYYSKVPEQNIPEAESLVGQSRLILQGEGGIGEQLLRGNLVAYVQHGEQLLSNFSKLESFGVLIQDLDKVISDQLIPGGMLATVKVLRDHLGEDVPKLDSAVQLLSSSMQTQDINARFTDLKKSAVTLQGTYKTVFRNM